MSELVLGRIVRTDARTCQVEVGGEVRTFALRGKLFEERSADVKSPFAVGDRVRVSLDGDPPSIEEVLPRTNWLARIASSHDPRAQILFANVDQLVVVASIAQPKFSSNRADRILAACCYYEIPAHILLNKVDLARDEDVRAIQSTYDAAGVPIVPACVRDGRGVDAMRALLAGKTTALYGGSGVGKSTLLNALEPGLALKVGTISRFWDQGKHTTTAAQMHRLPSLDAWVVDTPGIRVFRLAGVNQAELRDCFPEFAAFAERCEYAPTCSHDHEPGCAVFEAVEKGKLAPSRYASYVEIMDELSPPPEDVETVQPPER